MMASPLRVCRVCGLEAHNEVDLERFAKVKRWCKYKRRNICKECVTILALQYYREHPETNLKYSQNYRKTHHAQIVEANLLWQARNPEKRNAHVIAGRNIPLDSTCVNCGSTSDLARHHPDYSKPLEVTILCRKCHCLLHRMENDEARFPELKVKNQVKEGLQIHGE